MSLKQEIETWAKALEAYDAQEFEKALEQFETIADSSKILFNIALIHATLGNHDIAVENYNASNALDQYLAVSYFQCGVSNFLLGRYEDARRDFEDAYLYLRGNMTIDYEQLGLKFRLYSCEVLFNKGLSLIYMGREDEGLADLAEARKEKQTSEHSVIDEAYGDRGDGYTVFSIPVGVLYRPPEAKLKNLKAKNYLGKAKLVAATEVTDAFIGFTGSEKVKADLSRSKTTMGRMERAENEFSVPALNRRPTEFDAQKPTTSPLPAVAKPVPAPRAPIALQRSNTVAPPVASIEPATAREASRYVDDLLNDYADYPPPPVPQGQSKERVADWAAKNSGPKAPRGYGGNELNVKRAQSTRVRNNKDAYEEEGYGSDEEGPVKMKKIRVKIYYNGDVRGMSILPTISLFDFVDRIRGKFDLDATPSMKFKDEDGVQVSIKDEDDWEAAIDEARANSKGKDEGKLELTVA